MTLTREQKIEKIQLLEEQRDRIKYNKIKENWYKCKDCLELDIRKENIQHG